MFVNVKSAVVRGRQSSLLMNALRHLKGHARLVEESSRRIRTLVRRLVGLFILRRVIVVQKDGLRSGQVVRVFSRLRLVVRLITPSVLKTLKCAGSGLL